MSRPDVYPGPDVKKPKRNPLTLRRLKVGKLGGVFTSFFFGEPSRVSCRLHQGFLALDFPPWTRMLFRSLGRRSAPLLMYFLSL